MASGSNARARDARAKAAELLRQQKARDRKRRIIAWSSGVAALVVVAAVITIVVVGNAKPSSSVAAVPSTAPTVAVGAESTPPWNAPSDPSARAKAAGLSMLSSEGTVEHIHSHLSVSVDGSKVTVPALLGIDENAGSISPLHTHDETGVVHIESPVKTTFTLGQVFTEWDVALAAGRIGSYSSADGQAVTVFVDGKSYSGDPAAIQLASHEDIDIVVTKAGQKATAPKAFSWPAGL